MESLTELGIALFVATVLVSLFAITRLATRSLSSPAWLTSTLAAYIFAVPFTIAVATSFVYLGAALQPFMNVGLAGLVSVGAHLALLALFRTLLPVTDEAPKSEPARSVPQSSGAVAA